MSLSKILLPALLISCALPASAQLPTLPDKPWFGFFMGHETRDFRFGITEKGTMLLDCIDSKGTSLGSRKSVGISVEVVENLPDRKSVKTIVPTSLTSPDKPSEEFEKATFTGKVTGDAEFAVFVEMDGDVIKIGGRITNPGTIKNPLTLQINSRFQNLYYYTPDDKLEDAVEKDRVDFITLDKKRGKFGTFESIDLDSEKVSGKGLSNIRLEFKPIADKRFEYSLEGPGHLSMANPRGLSSSPAAGFSVLWHADPVKDPEGKGRMVLEVK